MKIKNVWRFQHFQNKSPTQFQNKSQNKLKINSNMPKIVRYIGGALADILVFVLLDAFGLPGDEDSEFAVSPFLPCGQNVRQEQRETCARTTHIVTR